MGTNSDLYDQDFFEWTQTTAALIRQGKRHEVALLAQRYPCARQKALDDTGLPDMALPQTYPWTAEQLLDEAFRPAGEARG
jgi:hypothetical protein